MKLIHTQFSSRPWLLMPLRLLVGFGFAAHGYAKLSRGPAQFAVILGAIGVPVPHVMAWITALLEFFGGIAIILGAFVVLVSLPLVGVMLTAMVSVHWQYGFSSVRLKAITPAGAEFGPIGYEMNLLYIVSLFTLAAFGSGKLSFDYWLSKQLEKAKATSAAR